MMAEDHDYVQLLAEQQREACELAYAAFSTGQLNDAMLKWFVEQLHYPTEWSTFVFMALIDRNRKTGELRWREARRPFGLISKITYAAALYWRPDLVFHNRTDVDVDVKAINSGHGRPASIEELRRPKGKKAAGVALKTRQDVVDYYQNVHWDSSDYDDEDCAMWFDVAEHGDGIVTSACRALGFDDDEAQIAVWRFIHRLSRRDIGGHWDERRAERVWRRVSRRFETPGFSVTFTKAIGKATDEYRAAYRPKWI
jgi:hypothetical protein